VTKGEGVVVAVIDSGLDPFNSLFKDRAVPGFNFLVRTTPPWSAEAPPMIDWGLHGTGCSSALLAVAPDCRIMPVRVHDGDTMNDPVYDYWIFEFVAAGIYYAVHHGAQVISLSAPLPATEPSLREAVRYAYRENVPLALGREHLPRPVRLRPRTRSSRPSTRRSSWPAAWPGRRRSGPG
jgi:subtilisin family serine protease